MTTANSSNSTLNSQVKPQYNKTADGWKYFKGINHDRLKQGKKDEADIFKKISDLEALPVGSNFTPTKAWNNRVDFRDEEKSLTLEIKRRFKNTYDEYPFKLDKTVKSTLLTYKKFEYLKENNGWLYLQYNDQLLCLEVSTLGDSDWIETWPFRVRHISIRLDKFNILCTDRVLQ